MTIKGAQAALLFLFLGTITLSIGLNLFLSIAGITALQAAGDAGQQAQNALTGSGLALSLLLYGAFTPLIEELVFRGLLYAAIYSYLQRHRKIRPAGHTPGEQDSAVPPAAGHAAVIAVIERSFPWRVYLPAALLSSLTFAIYHWNIAQGIYAFFMGLVFCLAYELTGQFLSPWILHAACNCISLLLSRSVNGTNAFTALRTWPWTAAFLAIAAVAFLCLYGLFHPQKSA